MEGIWLADFVLEKVELCVKMSRRASRRCADVQMCASVRRVHRAREMSQVESSQSCRGLLSIEHAVKETKSEEIQTKAVTSKVRPEK